MIKIGITHGDINGVGYEIILKALSDVRVLELFIPVIYGSTKVAAYHRKALEMPSVNLHTIEKASEAMPDRINIINCVNDEVKVELGKSTPESQKAAQISLERGLSDMHSGLLDALLTAPAYLTEPQEASFEQDREPLQILVKDQLRIALATENIPLSEVSSRLTIDLVTRKIGDLQKSLISDFALTAPRIAVLSFNPNTGSEGKQGKEEVEVIIPAIEKVGKEGIFCFGPYASDDFFGTRDYMKFDGILAMYYDQGMLPFKTISMDEGVCFTAGLPVVQIAPNQSPSFEIAGQNLASESAFLNAVYLAIDVFRNRKIDKEINANPLRKQYFEKGLDNEKLDLTSDL